MPLPAEFVRRAAGIVGGPFVLQDRAARDAYGADALKQTFPPDAVVLPASTHEISRIAALCSEYRTPIVVRGGGTGYTGGSVPIKGGIVVSLERLNRILEIDQLNLLARVQPNVITGDLQDAVERVGLFYPPDPSSLRESALGGNVAECAGGPRAFKYGTTRRYVLALEAVLANGEVIRTGSKAVKNVVGYDLTQLLVGSEGTLAIITEIVLRLMPKPPAHRTLRAAFADISAATDAVTHLIRLRVVPAAIELVDKFSLDALARHLGEALVPAGSAAALVVEVDGPESAVDEEIALVERACRAAGSTEVYLAATEDDRETIWRLRRELSGALKQISSIKFNHDVVVPRGRLPQLFELVASLRAASGLPIACFGHAGDGNIHVNIMVPESQAGDVDASQEPVRAGGTTRAREAERRLFEGVVALEGSISGEHGIGFTKAPYLGIELGPGEIALMKRVKAAFDPMGILNPGKIFPASNGV